MSDLPSLDDVPSDENAEWEPWYYYPGTFVMDRSGSKASAYPDLRPDVAPRVVMCHTEYFEYPEGVEALPEECEATYLLDLEPAEARKLAAMLLNAADAVDPYRP